MIKFLEFFKNFYFSFLKDTLNSLKFFFSANLDKFLNILFYGISLYFLYWLLKIFIKKIIQLRLQIKNQNLVIERIYTLSSVFSSILKILFWFAFLIFVLREFNIKIIPIITGAGVLGAALVYLFQGIIQDIIKGWLLIFEDQLRKGEWVNINNLYIGKVVEISLRHLVIRDRERNLIFLPNSQINTIVNLSREGKKKTIKLKVKRDIDLDNFFKEIEKIFQEVRDQSLNIQDLKIEKEINFGENFIEIFISFKTKFLLIEESSQKLKMELFKKLKDSLIEIV